MHLRMWTRVDKRKCIQIAKLRKNIHISRPIFSFCKILTTIPFPSPSELPDKSDKSDKSLFHLNGEIPCKPGRNGVAYHFVAIPHIAVEKSEIVGESLYSGALPHTEPAVEVFGTFCKTSL